MTNKIFTSHSELQKFTDKTRKEYINGVKHEWDYGLVELNIENRKIIEDISNIEFSDINLVFYSSKHIYCRIYEKIYETEKFMNRHYVNDNFAIAGGYALYICSTARYFCGDIDIFPIGKFDHEFAMNNLSGRIYTYRSNNAITGLKTTEDELDIQYVLHPSETISQLLYSFDIPMAQICIWKNKIYVTYEWIFEAYNGMICPNKTRMSYNYHNRLRKYIIKKGAAVCYKNYFNNVRNSNNNIFDILDILPNEQELLYYGTTYDPLGYIKQLNSGKVSGVLNYKDAKASYLGYTTEKTINHLVPFQNRLTMWFPKTTLTRLLKQNKLTFQNPTNIIDLRMQSEQKTKENNWYDYEYNVDIGFFPKEITDIILGYYFEVRRIDISKQTNRKHESNNPSWKTLLSFLIIRYMTS